VECVTAQVGAGANLVLFTTGLGTPTGNSVAPVIKISTNSALADRMGDIVDFDAGGIVTGEITIAECAAFRLSRVLLETVLTRTVLKGHGFSRAVET
jgi:altronate hydrolase